MDEQPAAKSGPHMMDEPDVGSGEKTPGQRETEALIESIGERPAQPGVIPPPPPVSSEADRQARTAQSAPPT